MNLMSLFSRYIGVEKFSKDAVSLDFERKTTDSEEELYDDDQPYEDDMNQIEESDEPLDDIDDRPSSPAQQVNPWYLRKNMYITNSNSRSNFFVCFCQR